MGVSCLMVTLDPGSIMHRYEMNLSEVFGRLHRLIYLWLCPDRADLKRLKSCMVWALWPSCKSEVPHVYSKFVMVSNISSAKYESGPVTMSS